MISAMVVVDAVTHPYDLAAPNQNLSAQEQLDAVYAAHRMAADVKHLRFVVAHDEFFSDFSYQTV